MKIFLLFILIPCIINPMMVPVEKHHHTSSHISHHHRHNSKEEITINVNPEKNDDNDDKRYRLKLALIAGASTIMTSAVTVGITLAVYFTNCKNN